MLVEAFVAQATVEPFPIGVLVQLAALDQGSCTPRACAQLTITLLRSSLPLSVRITCGKPRSEAGRSSTHEPPRARKSHATPLLPRLRMLRDR